MSDEDEKIEIPHKTKSILPSLIVIISCLCLILALLPLLLHNRLTPDYRNMCRGNFSSVGRAMIIYAHDYNYIVDYLKSNPHLGDEPVDIEDLVNIGKSSGP